MTFTHLSLVAIVLIAQSSGCAKSDPHTELSLDRAAEGSILPHVEKLHAHTTPEACDRDVETRQMQLELAQAIDSRTPEIQELTGQIQPDRHWHRASLGPIHVLERVSRPKFHPGWQKYVTDWKDIYAFYKRIKNKPTDESWLALNSEVRAIILDDQYRLKGMNFSLDQNSGPLLASALRPVSECLKDSKCTKPAFSRHDREFLSRFHIYRDWLKTLDQEGEVEKKRKTIQDLHDWVSDDYERYLFRPNTLLKRSSQKELRISLSPGPFSEVRERLASYIESIWSSEELSIRIDWIDPTFPEVFRFIVENAVGGRSWVNKRERLIHIYDEVTIGTLAHEFGHVLGFADHYYTVWNPESCTYTHHLDDSDLMSNSRKGVVTPGEWKIISTVK